MSGGSYNYLFRRDAEEVFGVSDDFRRARDRLEGLGYAQDVSDKVTGILSAMADFRADMDSRLSEVADVLQALEWWDSNDWGEDQFQEALAKFRASAAKS